MGTWLAIEAVATLLAVLAAVMPDSAPSEPKCDRAAVEAECEDGRTGGER